MNSSSLFEKNINLLQRLNSQFEDKNQLSKEIKVAESKSNSPDLSFDNWLNNPRKAVVLPLYLPRTQERLDGLKSYLDDCKISNYADIVQFKELHADYHSAKNLISIIDLLNTLGVDYENAITTLNPGCVSNFISVGTGRGETLLEIIEKIRPHRVLIAIDEWSDLISSFWHIDWENLFNQIQCRNQKLDIVRIKSDEDLLTQFADYSILSLDHSLVYQASQATKTLLEKSDILFGRRPSALLEYTGYTVDEYNMIINTVDTLSLQPKILNLPSYPLGFKAIICASGPSLDDSLEQIKELQSSHIIIAGGSSVRTLLRAGIRVDIVTLLERDEGTALAYTELSSEFDLSNIRLVMSTTCYPELVSIFKDTLVFFRPAITPIAIFSSTPKEKLEFEGPESVNLAVSFCCNLGAQQIVFFGVDLGTSNLERDRSSDAAGFTPRKFTIEVEGNFKDVSYTTQALLDCMHQIKTCLGVFSKTTKAFNASDGVKIEYADCICSDTYVFKYNDHSPNNNNLWDWWDSLSIYDISRLKSSWEIRRPRLNTRDLSIQLKSIFDDEFSWFPDVLLEIEKKLSLNVPPPQQIPIRIMRSTILRAVLAISQQAQTMYYEREKMKEFITQSKLLMKDIIQQMEDEIYSLCDYIDQHSS